MHSVLIQQWGKKNPKSPALRRLYLIGSGKNNPNAANQKTQLLDSVNSKHCWVLLFHLFFFFDGGRMGIITAGVPEVKETLKTNILSYGTD